MVKQLKKTVMVTLFSATALVLFATPADATTKDDKTDVGVSFKATGPNTPGENGPFKDNLALIWKPTAFTFGEQKAIADKATYNGTLSGQEYVVINDDRQDAETDRWELKAKLTELKSKDGAAKLANASLAIGFDAPQSYELGTNPDSSGNDYTPNKPTKDYLGELAPNSDIEASSTVTLTAGGEAHQVLAKTNKNAVKGGVAAKISSTKLTVLSSKDLDGKSFNGQVIWTLDDFVK